MRKGSHLTGKALAAQRARIAYARQFRGAKGKETPPIPLPPPEVSKPPRRRPAAPPAVEKKLFALQKHAETVKPQGEDLLRQMLALKEQIAEHYGIPNDDNAVIDRIAMRATISGMEFPIVGKNVRLGSVMTYIWSKCRGGHSSTREDREE